MARTPAFFAGCLRAFPLHCDENPKGEIQAFALIQETYNHFHAICVCVKFGELPINTLQVLRDQGSCLSKILNMRCSSLILMPEFHLCQVTSPHIQYCIILIPMKPLVSGFVWLVKCPNQSTKNILDAYVCKWYNSDVARMTKIK